MDENGRQVDTDLFKVISPKVNIMDDGMRFPFFHSTMIYPEWPVSALPHVDRVVVEEVQQALLALERHANSGEAYNKCLGELQNVTICEELSFPDAFDSEARCDTTKSLAQLALDANQQGELAGFHPARSYFSLLTMLEAAGFLEESKNGKR